MPQHILPDCDDLLKLLNAGKYKTLSRYPEYFANENGG